MQEHYDVYGIGNALVDTEYEVDDAFLEKLSIRKGVMTLIEYERKLELTTQLEQMECPTRHTGGGSAANTMVALAQLGGSAFYSCRVADDEIGDFYLKDLLENEVDTNLVHGRHDGITGRCIVMVTPDAERTMNTYLGATRHLTTAELVPAALAVSTYVYLEGYLVSEPGAREAVKEAQRIARESGVKVALTLSDPSMVENFRDHFLQIAGRGLDLLFCNREEALIWAKTRSLDVAVEKLRGDARSFVITLGAKGALVYDGSAVTPVDSYKVRAVDTNGAGDMFAGAFLYGITHGYSYPLAADLGNRASAKLVEAYGARMPQEELLRVREWEN